MEDTHPKLKQVWSLSERVYHGRNVAVLTEAAKYVKQLPKRHRFLEALAVIFPALMSDLMPEACERYRLRYGKAKQLLCERCYKNNPRN